MNGNKTTQNQKVLEHLEQYGVITPLEAMREYGIMRLASRISDLKRAGFPIKSRIVGSKNREGQTIHFAEYYVGGDD